MTPDPSTVIVEPGSEILQRDGVQILHTYTNGTQLVRLPEALEVTTEARRVEVAAVPEKGPSRVAVEDRRESIDDIEDGATVYAYIQLAGPPEGSVVEALEASGLELVNFEPPSNYLALGDRAAFAHVAELGIVDDVVLQSARLKPSLRMPERGAADVWVVLHAATADRTVDDVRQIADLEVVGELERSTGPYRRLAARADGGATDDALALPGVAAVEPRFPIEPEDEVADLIIAGSVDSRTRPVGNYLRWLEDHGIDGSGVTIGIVDNGVDENHGAFSGRIVAADGGREAWHGTFVAGHAAGDLRDERDANGFIYGVGVAPGADLVTQYNRDSAATNCGATVSTPGRSSGANGTIQNNSWGAGTEPAGMDYGSLEDDYDGFVRDADGSGTPLTICFSAGNEGSDGLTRPKAAKNVIVTGNSESYRPEFATDNPTAAPEADDPDEMYTGRDASSHGNCSDGRIRPHVCAPGEWTSAANFGIVPGQAEYISDQMTWGGGTSGASPKTAGACALLTGWWMDNIGGATPSPAMLRAMLVNGATDMGFGGPIPNQRQGWGRLNLGAVLDESVHKLYVDQSIVLTRNGDERRWNLQVSDPTKPVRVTLAWTDPPGAAGSGTAAQSAVVNRLGLVVDEGGNTYHGNDFSGGWSRAGSRPDDEGSDNLQNVFLRGGTVGGRFTVTVRAVQLAMNCLTNRASDPQQDFSLVIHNAHLDAGASPIDMSILVDDRSDGPPRDDHWDDDDDDAGNDNDDRWGDGSTRPTLRRGDRNDDVRDLQELLNDQGYDTNGVDGVFGGGTLAAVKRFQRDQGLHDDGVVGALTWEALEGRGADRPSPTDDVDDRPDDGPADRQPPDVSDRPTLRRGDRGDDVRDLQQMLNDLGYDTNGIDGQFGGGTLAAVTSFQRDQSLGADGVVGPNTWQRLAELWDNGAGSGGADDDWDDWDDWNDWDDWDESSPRTTEARPAPVAATALLELAGEYAGEHDRITSPAADDAIAVESSGGTDAITGSVSVGLARLVAESDDRADDGTVRTRVALLVVGRGSTFGRADLVAMRRLARLGGLYLLSDDADVLGWLAQRLQVGRGVHYRLTVGDGGVEGAVRAALAEARGHHVAMMPERASIAGDSVAVRLDLTEIDETASIYIRHADSSVRVTEPGGEPIEVSPRSRRSNLRLRTLDSGTLKLTITASDDDGIAGSWVIEARSAGDRRPELEAHVAGVGPARLRVDPQPSGTPATEASSRSPSGLVVAEARQGSLVRVRVRAVTDTETSRERVELSPRPSRYRATPDGPHAESEPDGSAPQIAGVMPLRPSCGVTDVVVEARGISEGGHGYARRWHDDIVRVMSRSEFRRARGSESDGWELLRGQVTEVQFDRGGLVMALLVRARSGRRLLRVDDIALRELLAELELGDGEYLFGLSGNVVQSVIDPFEPAA